MGSVPRYSVCGSTPSFASLGTWCGKGSAAAPDVSLATGRG